MKKFKSVLIVVLAMSSFLVFAQDDEDVDFDKRSTWQEQEVTTEKDGKTVKTKRIGRPKMREGAPRVGEIYESDESRIEKRIRSKKFTAYGFGPYSGLGQDDMLYNFSYGKNWETGVNTEILFSVDYTGNSSAGLGTMTLGAGYMFSSSDISPYASAELGYGAGSEKDEDGSSGFAGKAAVGMRLFRTSDTQLAVGFNVNTIFTKEAPTAYGITLKLLH